MLFNVLLPTTGKDVTSQQVSLIKYNILDYYYINLISQCSL